MTRSLTAGLGYVTIVFAAGFALGVVRVFWLMPAVGDLAGVAFELPIILTLSWFVCGWLIERFQVPPRLAERASMGGVALVVLLLAEMGVSVLLAGSGLDDLVRAYLSPAGALSALGQLIFALLPVLRLPQVRAAVQTA